MLNVQILSAVTLANVKQVGRYFPNLLEQVKILISQVTSINPVFRNLSKIVNYVENFQQEKNKYFFRFELLLR